MTLLYLQIVPIVLVVSSGAAFGSYTANCSGKRHNYHRVDEVYEHHGLKIQRVSRVSRVLGVVLKAIAIVYAQSVRFINPCRYIQFLYFPALSWSRIEARGLASLRLSLMSSLPPFPDVDIIRLIISPV